MERRLQRENLNGAGETFEDIKQMDLSGEKPLGEAKTAKTKTSNFDYNKERVTEFELPAAARQADVARDYLKRAARIDGLNGQSSGSVGPMVNAFKRHEGGRVLAFVQSSWWARFAEMSGVPFRC